MKICKMEPAENGYAYCEKLSAGFLSSQEEGFYILATTIKKFLPYLKSLPKGNLLDYQAYPLHLAMEEKKMVPQTVYPFWRLPVLPHNQRYFPEKPYSQLEQKISELFSTRRMRDFERDLLRNYDFEMLPAKYLLDFAIQKIGREKKWLYREVLGYRNHTHAFAQLTRFSLRGNYLANKVFIAKIGYSEDFAEKFLSLWRKWITKNCLITQNCKELE